MAHGMAGSSPKSPPQARLPSQRITPYSNSRHACSLAKARVQRKCRVDARRQCRPTEAGTHRRGAQHRRRPSKGLEPSVAEPVDSWQRSHSSAGSSSQGPAPAASQAANEAAQDAAQAGRGRHPVGAATAAGQPSGGAAAEAAAGTPEPTKNALLDFTTCVQPREGESAAKAPCRCETTVPADRKRGPIGAAHNTGGGRARDWSPVSPNQSTSWLRSHSSAGSSSQGPAPAASQAANEAAQDAAQAGRGRHTVGAATAAGQPAGGAAAEAAAGSDWLDAPLGPGWGARGEALHRPGEETVPPDAELGGAEATKPAGIERDASWTLVARGQGRRTC
jgi:hypothetical protein